MRELMFSWEYPPYVVGGMGHHVEELAPALLVANPSLELHLVTPVFSEKDRDEHEDRLHVHRVRVARPSHDDYFGGVCRANDELLRRSEALVAEIGEFDLVHTHDWLVGFAAEAFSAAHGVPLLATIHATERGRLRGHVLNDLQRSIDDAERRLVQSAQRVITCSRAMASEVEEYFGLPQEEIVVIPNGVRIDRFDWLTTLEHDEFRQRFAKPDEQIVFNVGRLVYEKGADLLIEAAPRVLERMPKTKFIIAGTGPLLHRLEQRVEQLGLGEQIKLPGFLSYEDRDRLYLLASCCVFPSRYEPFGIVALESMAAGTPVVVSNVGGLGTVVKHEETGITVYPDDVESLVWGILRILEGPDSARQRAERARVAVRRQFSWSHIADLTNQVGAELSREGVSLASTPHNVPPSLA